MIRWKSRPKKFLSLWPRDHRYSIPGADLHAERAAGASVVIGLHAGGGRFVTDANEAIVPRSDRDTRFTTSALIEIHKGDAGRRLATGGESGRCGRVFFVDFLRRAHG